MPDAAIEFRDVTYTTAQGRVLLDHITVSVPVGDYGCDSWAERVRQDDSAAYGEPDA